MRPRRDPVPRARDAWVWLGGLALLGVLGAGVIGAAIVLWENIDIRQLVPQLAAAAPPAPLPEEPAPGARDQDAFRAVILDSDRNRAYFPDSTYYESNIEAWRALVSDVGGVVADAGGAEELEELTPDDLLVLVEAPCLSDAEREAIRDHLDAGGSVVSNWAAGARDGDCEWSGWDMVADLTSTEDVRELPVRDGLYLTVPSDVALSPGFDPGTRIELRPEPSLAVRFDGPRVYWSDWALNPAPDESGGGADVAAAALRTPEGGRVSWFGLRVGQGATVTDSLRLHRLVQNGILWAAGTPVASPAAWPGGERAALLFTLDVEDEASNALQMADMLREEGLPGTFFAVSQIVQEDAALADALIAAGEVGTQTSDHTPVVGLTAQDQRFRLRRAWSDITRWTDVAPSGLRPPEETFDANTLTAWQQAGGEYILANNEARSGSPELHRVGGGTIVLLPRLLKDDYNLIVQDRILRATSLAEAFLEGTRKMHAIGGLAVVAGHTQIMRSGGRVDALRTVADTARAQGDWWIARADEIASWWRARSTTNVRFVTPEQTDPLPEGFRRASLSDILVEAPSAESLQDLWIDVVVPQVEDALVPLVDGEPVDFATTEWGVRVPVRAIPAGGDRRISFLLAAEADEVLGG